MSKKPKRHAPGEGKKKAKHRLDRLKTGYPISSRGVKGGVITKKKQPAATGITLPTKTLRKAVGKLAKKLT